MRSRNWPGKFALACATISLPAVAQQPPPAPVPAASPVPGVALVDAADAAQWQALVKPAGWRVITGAAADFPDARVQSLAAAVAQATKEGVDPARVYLAGRGAATAAVFYTISRVPDLWAAAIGIDGSPQAAIDTDRLFAANFTTVPVLWLGKADADQPLAAKLKDAGLKLEFRPAAGVTNQAVLDWLAGHRREAYPAEIDCETNAPAFASCFWVRMSRFDPQERNDMLASTRIAAATVASLNLGAFGFNPDEPGPGALVTVLPNRYYGPLKVGDRIVALEGRPLENARAYLDAMAKYTEEKPVVATVQRGKDRIRMETRVVVPRKDPVVTARVQAKYLPADREIQIVTRTVKEMRVTIPPQWAGDTRLYWNGLALEQIDGPGCYVLTEESELLHATRCK
jgi:hypothetical protein